jgi:hypothetical protein
VRSVRPVQRAEEIFAALNIEGAIVLGDELCLLQRGNKRTVENAVIRFRSPALLGCSDQVVRSQPQNRWFRLRSARSFLAKSAGSRFASPMRPRVAERRIRVFLRSPKTPKDNYNDGPCKGSAIGVAIDRDACAASTGSTGRTRSKASMRVVADDVIRLLLVTDADDRCDPGVAVLRILPF